MQAPLAQISWYHHITLLDKVKETDHRLFYIQKTVEHGWSRNVMVLQIESELHKRQGALTNNFKQTIPDFNSDLTQQLFKDPYNFDFLSLGKEAKERDLENGLIENIIKVLLELGDGFAFKGKQYLLKAGEKEYFLDLLFYHTGLRRHIVIELKIGEFLPEYVGKMNLYLGLADDKLKGQYDEPSIGLILCKTKDKIVAEYALRDTSKPIGIAEYKINQLLPEDIKGELPSIEELEQELDKEIEQNLNPVDARLKAVKERIKSLQSDEIKTPATYELLQNIFEKGVKPLFQQIIQKMMDEFNEAFFSQTASWTCGNRIVHSIAEVEEFWKKEESLRGNDKLSFSYGLHGFRKGGTENLGAHIDLSVRLDTYSYGIYLDHKNESFIKKLYDKPLTQEDIQKILDALIIKVLERMEWIVEHLNTLSKKQI